MIKIDQLEVHVPGFRLGPVNFDFQAGAINLIRGSNGSGKTTLLRTLLGRQRPSRGGISGVEYPVGIVGWGSALMGAWTVEENWEFFRDLYRRASTLPLPSEVQKFYKKRVDHLSEGQKRRAEIAFFFALKLKTYFLDEAFQHLDKESRIFFGKELVKLTSQGATVLMTTHFEEELPQPPARILQL